MDTQIRMTAHISTFTRKLLAWLKKPLTEQVDSLHHRFVSFRDIIFEKSYRLDFDGNIPKEELITEFSKSLPHAKAYEPFSATILRLFLREIEKTGIAFTNFIDIGSGKGKTCIYVAKVSHFRTVIGVEFSQPLIDIAEANKTRCKLSNVTFLNTDATEYKLPNANNVVFLFNPFDEIAFRKFISNNMGHFIERQSVIVYANDEYRFILIQMGFETLFRNQAPKLLLFKYRAAP
jgi:SAM-dependent methyltransferase